MADSFYSMLALANIRQGVVLMVVGMLVVFVSLIVLSLVIGLLNRILGDANADGTGGTGPTTTAIDAHLIVVLTAAATAALGPVRIRNVTLLNDARSGGASVDSQ
jgi:hypothetical protein